MLLWSAFVQLKEHLFVKQFNCFDYFINEMICTETLQSTVVGSKST